MALQARQGGQVALTVEMLDFLSWVTDTQVFSDHPFYLACLKYLVTDFLRKGNEASLTPPFLPLMRFLTASVASNCLLPPLLS